MGGVVGYIFGLRKSREEGAQTAAERARAFLRVRGLTRSEGEIRRCCKFNKRSRERRDDHSKPSAREGQRVDCTWTIEKFRN